MNHSATEPHPLFPTYPLFITYPIRHSLHSYFSFSFLSFSATSVSWKGSGFRLQVRFSLFVLILFLFFFFFFALLPPVHFSVFFFFKRTDSGPVSARIENEKKKKKKFSHRCACSRVHSCTMCSCVSDSGALAQSAHSCFLLYIKSSFFTNFTIPDNRGNCKMESSR